MTSAQLIADSTVSLATIAGLVMLVCALRRSASGDQVGGRFQFGLMVLIVMLTARLFGWLTGSGFFLAIALVMAGLVPLAVMILTEGLLRRHAPLPVKYLLIGGTAMFTALALVPAPLVDPGRGYMLLFYQMLAFLIVAWMVLRRDRASLSAHENQLIDRLALSLLLILPFLATEFRLPGLDLPVRLGGVAILFLCWMAMARNGLGNRLALGTFAVLAATAIVAGLAIAMIADMGAAGGLQAMAIALSASLVAMIYNDSVNLAAEERRGGLLNHIAYAPDASPSEFMQGLREYMMLEGALLLGPEELRDHDLKILTRIFADDPVRMAARLPPVDGASQGDDADRLHALFERFEATHLMQLDLSPLTLMAINMPSLASSPKTEAELRAVQRVAHLMSERGHDHDQGK